jgi:hypothetical protein
MCDQDIPRSHTIDLLTEAGLADFLTIFNYFELANVFYSKTYGEGLSRREFADFVEARRLSRAILKIYNGQFVLTTSTSTRHFAISALQRTYLSGQARALVRYKRQMNDIGVTNNIPLATFLDELHSLSEPYDPLFPNAVAGTDVPNQDPFRDSLGWPAGLNHYKLRRKNYHTPSR